MNSIKPKHIVLSVVILIPIVFVAVLIIPVVQMFITGSTYIGTVKTNWGVSLPKPDHQTTIMSNRGGIQGDGDAVTELQYNSQSDITKIKSLSKNWTDGTTFEKEEKTISENIGDVIKHVDPKAKYFYLRKNNSLDFVVFELNGYTLTVYESYT